MGLGGVAAVVMWQQGGGETIDSGGSPSAHFAALRRGLGVLGPSRRRRRPASEDTAAAMAVGRVGGGLQETDQPWHSFLQHPRTGPLTSLK